MSNYFRRLPNLDYPSLLKNRESNTDFIQTKNLFRRTKIREDLFANFMQFDKYEIVGDERPDQVAFDFYEDSGLDWVVLTTNNIIHVRDEWPMGNQDFLTYLNDKYTSQELSNINHYETDLLRDSQGKLIQPKGLTVPGDYSINFLDNGVLRTESKITSFTFFDHETNLNDKKRNIDILKPEYLTIFLENFEEIMEYKPSKQFINDKLKKTENPRIISP